MAFVSFRIAVVTGQIIPAPLRPLAVVAISLAALIPSIPAQRPAAAPSQALRESLLHPPAEARPMVRWWWFGAAVEKPEILLELRQMKADGIGGAELAFVYPEVLDDPARGLRNLPFLSPAMLDAVHYAQTEGRKLGLRIDVTLCSGWPYGGPATTLAEAASRLRTVEMAVPPGASSVASPQLAAGESVLSAALVLGSPTPASPHGSRVPPAAISWDAASAAAFTPTPNTTSILPASAPRVALFFLESPTRQQVKRAAVGAEGFVLDPFSRAAVATHLRAVGEPLLSAFGTTPPYAIFSDSLEAYGADWTPTLPAEFLKRRGYDLLPHLPELVAGGSPAADAVRHDYGRTLTELVDQNYLLQINAWAAAHHTLFRSQTYGEPAVSFSSQNLVDLAEGEGPQWRTFSTLKWATSANHVFGRNVSSGETFTWLHSPVFRATPLDMKAEADLDFIMGENQLIFHGWPYSPPQASASGEPGWSLYAAAALNDHNPWHPVMPAVTQYITRVNGLLRQGEPANQVAVLLPTDDAWASFSPGHVTVSGAMQKLVSPALVSAILSAGYNFDFIDADAIDKVGLGSHSILVIPPTDRIPIQTLRSLRAFAKSGGKVICIGRAPVVDAEGKPLTGSNRLPETASFVQSEANLPSALHAASSPDLQIATDNPQLQAQLGFIRRKLPDSDLYFLVNTGNTPLDTSVSFATTHPFAEQWNPETETFHRATARAQRLHLAPYESRVFVFTDKAVPDHHDAPPTVFTSLADISANWHVAFSGSGKSADEPTLTDWASDPATRNFSGEAIYTRDFDLPQVPRGPLFLDISGGIALPGAPDSVPVPQVLGPNGLPNPLVTGTGPGMRAFFDPPIREAALVFINGQPAGALWHPPYRLDLSAHVKPGRNHLEIRVYNTALNAWSALPPHNYKPLIQKYGDRFQMQDLDQVKPLSSGLLGPVHLVTGSPE